MINIQEFFNNDAAFLPKKIALLALEANIIGHWIIASEFSYSLLSESKQHANILLTSQHGKPWYKGSSAIEAVYNNLRAIIHNAEQIYTRGFMQKRLLEMVVCKEIINIDDMFDKPPVTVPSAVGIVCSYHSALTTGFTGHCSMSAANYYRSDISCYFDSYGMPPIISEHLRRLRENCRYFRHSDKHVQQEDFEVCGQYCIIFLHAMSINYRLRNFLSCFGKKHSDNDKIVAEYYKTSMKKERLKYNKNTFIGKRLKFNQICLS